MFIKYFSDPTRKNIRNYFFLLFEIKIFSGVTLVKRGLSTGGVILERCTHRQAEACTERERDPKMYTQKEIYRHAQRETSKRTKRWKTILTNSNDDGIDNIKTVK